MAAGSASSSAPHHLVTVDAESAVIADGIRTISAIRERVESEEDVEIPIVWFVRFQRSWTEYATIDSTEYFSGPITDGFDGFDVAAAELGALRERGDEIGWHYHAYSYVHRDDLSHEQKLAILHADLEACAAEIRRRHGDDAVRSFRFGWFFVPDYELYATLREGGVRVDASVHSKFEGRTVATFQAAYPPPITRSPREVDGIWFVPFVRTTMVHDWDVVPHEFNWRSQDEAESAETRELLEAGLRRTVGDLRQEGGTFQTYERMLAAAGA